MNDTSPAIVIHSLTKTFGERTILNGVDLEVQHGETLVILGASGSGKSTLLRCMVGLERPDSGTVHVLGTDMFDTDPIALSLLRRRIGMAFQGGALFGSMSLAGNIDLVLAEFTRLPRSTRRIIARIKLGMVGLEEALDRYPSQLSGGMRKRAALARAMTLDPDILFFDEPSAGLDPVTGANLDELINEQKKVFRTTMVVVTHEMASAFAIADRMALIHQGRFLVVGSPKGLQESTNPVIRQFLDRIPAPTRRGSDKLHRLLDDH